MGIFNGTDVKVFFDGTPDTALVDTTEFSIDTNVNPIDKSTKDSGGWAENMPGQRSWSGSVSGKVDFIPGSNEANVLELMALAFSNAQVDIIAKNTQNSLSGKATLTKVGFSAPMEDACTYTMDYVGSGPLTIADVV